MSRDEFRAKTRETLAARAGMRCSNPSCRRGTTKADPSNPENWVNLGIAAHITAASAKGPRYDASLSSDQRRSAQNGIWLCQHCAKEVDSTTSTYCVETLRTWKQQAEACTARDAAATLDEVSRVIAAIENARGLIADYIDERRANDPDDGTFAESHAERQARVQELVRYGGETQTEWDRRVAPMVSDCLTRAMGLLGEQHSAVKEAKEAFWFARTNILVMKDMAEALDVLRTHLLLR